MKTLFKVGLIILIIGLVGSIGFGIWAYPELKEEGDIVEHSLTYEKDQFEGIHLEFMDQGVEIKKSTDGKIHIDFNRRSFEELTVVDTESTLKIMVTSTWIQRFTHRTFFFFNWFTKRTATIELPENLYTIYVKTMNGGFNVDGVDSKSMNLVTLNGKISVLNVQTENLTLRTSNGSINLVDVSANSINMESSNGKLTFNNVTSPNITAESSNGDIIIDTVNGEVMSYKTSNGRITGTNITSNNGKFTTSNGGINVSINGVFEDYKVKTKTSNGDVKINDVKYSNATYHETKIPYIEATTSNGNVRINFLP